ncbi:predicted protein [Lichtheimia corymbifera JMRC:FSU:9682]|uniref:Uncharacterized protein n=1 Tax=Lichtheimia corymbifera JMRC:FSU:9682 TaxID=1263082 RepID=A0A068RS28_9FUNG|nr:predicted protein [Lichtheimia corymbifera JMRC:FSU:9682]
MSIVKHREVIAAYLNDKQASDQQRFGIVAKELGVKVGKGKVNWDAVRTAIIAHRSKNSLGTAEDGSSTSVSIATSSSTSSTSLASSVDIDQYAMAYSSLDKKKMWTLKTGKVVEEEMKRHALRCKNEHPCHSFIFDINDAIWVQGGYFTDEEVEEIQSCNAINLPKPESTVMDYLKTYENKHTLDTIFEASHHAPFHPLPDIIRRVWGFIEEAFDESVFNVRCGEKASKSSSSSRNATRTNPGCNDMDRKLVGSKVDMMIRFMSDEYACAEASRNNNHDTKELVEGSFKCPKSMRDMFFHLASSNPDQLRNIRTFGFIFSGLKMTILVMDCPAGYTCRLQRLGPLHYPETEQVLVTRLTSLILTIGSIKQLMKHTLQAMQNENVFVPTFSSPEPTCPLPPTYHVKGRKRKASAITSPTTDSV